MRCKVNGNVNKKIIKEKKGDYRNVNKSLRL